MDAALQLNLKPDDLDHVLTVFSYWLSIQYSTVVRSAFHLRFATWWGRCIQDCFPTATPGQYIAARITTDTLVCWRSKYIPGPSEAPVRLFFAKQIPSRVRKEMHRLTARLKDGDTVSKETMMLAQELSWLEKSVSLCGVTYYTAYARCGRTKGLSAER